MEERACQLALYLIENRATVRAAAGKFGVSKSTVNKDLSEIKPPEGQRVFIHKLNLLDSLTIDRYNVENCWNWEQR